MKPTTQHYVPDEEQLNARAVIDDIHYVEKLISRQERKHFAQDFPRGLIREWAELLIRERIEREVCLEGVHVKIHKFDMKTVYNNADDQKPIRFSCDADYRKPPYCGCGCLVRVDTVEEAVTEVMKSVDWVLRSINPDVKKERPPEGKQQVPVQYDLSL